MSLTGLAFALLFVTGCVLALTRRPIFGLITYVGFFYLHPPSRWWGQAILADIRWSFVAAGITLLAVLIHQRGRNTQTSVGQSVFVGMVLFIAWIAIQSSWAMESDWHGELLELYVKYAIAAYLVYRCVDSESDLRLFMWTHVAGCGYFGILAFTATTGGRFEGFGGPGLGEANVGALQLVTGVFVAASLFLYEKGRWRLAVLAVIPFIANALVATASRSGFLAMVIGGVAYAAFSARHLRKTIIVLSVPAVVLFVMLTNADYWMRIETIKYRGQQVESIDTGGGRLEIMKAQWEMFKLHPLGCGHRCTAFLSSEYLEDRFLTGIGVDRARSSHNTFMTCLVEQGVVGAMFYIAMLVWVLKALRRLKTRQVGSTALVAAAIPATGAALVSLFVGDMFVSNVRFEARFWFIALLIALLRLSSKQLKGVGTVKY